MLKRLAKLRQKRANGDRGFTLIELLVVVVILGILIAIAIPLYLNYRKGANDSAAKSDLRNAISTLEQCNTDNSAYPSAAFTLNASGVAGTCTAQTINLSKNTSFTYTPVAAAYRIVDTNSAGSTGPAKFYCYDSAKGGAVISTTATYASLAAAVTGVTGATGCV